MRFSFEKTKREFFTRSAQTSLLGWRRFPLFKAGKVSAQHEIVYAQNICFTTFFSNNLSVKERLRFKITFREMKTRSCYSCFSRLRVRAHTKSLVCGLFAVGLIGATAAVWVAQHFLFSGWKVLKSLFWILRAVHQQSKYTENARVNILKLSWLQQ